MHVTWERGGSAAVLALDGERITLSSTIPRAPGAPLAGALASGSAIKIKVASCRREGPSFILSAKLIDATRALRAEIAALLPPGSAAPPRP